MQYQIITERLEHPDIGTYQTYGLRQTQTGQIIRDISTDREFVAAMARLFDRCRLEAVHFQDAVADFVSCPEALREVMKEKEESRRRVPPAGLCLTRVKL